MADVDIEDLQVDQDAPKARAAAKAWVRPCSSTSSSSQARGKDSAPPSSQVPGTQAIWVKTFGCSHNVSDAEYMMGQLQEYGYRCGVPAAAAAASYGTSMHSTNSCAPHKHDAKSCWHGFAWCISAPAVAAQAGSLWVERQPTCVLSIISCTSGSCNTRITHPVLKPSLYLRSCTHTLPHH